MITVAIDGARRRPHSPGSLWGPRPAEDALSDDASEVTPKASLEGPTQRASSDEEAKGVGPFLAESSVSRVTEEDRDDASHREKPSVGTSSSARSLAAPGATRSALRNLTILAAFYGSGVLFFCLGPEKWTIIKAVYFLTVTVTTVGYGDVTPSATLSQAIAMLYIFVGLVVILPLCTTTVVGIIDRQEAGLKRFAARCGGCVSEMHFKVAYSLGLIVIILLVGCVFFGVREVHQGDWSVIDPLWWTVATMTTIGYGDLEFGHNTSARLFLIFFIPVAVVTVGAAITNLAHAREDILQLRREQALLARFDIDVIKALDTDGDGIDRQEYILGMLQAMDLVDPAKVQLYSAQFDEYDADGSGRLDEADLDLIAARMKDAAAASVTPATPPPGIVPKAADAPAGRTSSHSEAPSPPVQQKRSLELDGPPQDPPDEATVDDGTCPL